MGYGGKPLMLPHPGDPAVPGAIYIRRVRFGYGTTDRTAGGASDGCNVWADTQSAFGTDAFPLIRIAAVSSDLLAMASDNPLGGVYGGIIVHAVDAFVKTAFTASVDLSVFDTGVNGGADSDAAWGAEADIGATTANSRFLASTGPGTMLYNTTDQCDIMVESSGADIAAGILDVFVSYSYADMQSLPGTDYPDTLAG
jgi:hypothetical protein